MDEIDAAALASSLTGDDLLIDVREPGEFSQAHVPGARLLPLGQVSAALDELPRDRRVYVVCASGNRSRVAVDLLSANGVDAVNVAGGTTGWIRAGHPTESGPR